MMETYLRQFGSLTDWINYAESPYDAPLSTRASVTRPQSFNGTPSLEAAFTLFRKGWPEGKQRMLSILDDIRNTIILESTKYDFFPSVEGCAPNVEAYIQGIPEDMFHLQEEETICPPSFLCVQIEGGFLSNIIPEQMTWAGATIYAAIEALRAQGCAVQILLSHGVRSRHTGAIWQSTVPIPNTIDIDTASFLFTHPATLRRINFAIREHESIEIRRQMGFYNGGGYGQTHAMKVPQADYLLSICAISKHFTQSNSEYNLTVAKQIVRNLVDTKFKSYTK